MPAEDLAALADDIKVNGLREPITLTPDGLLLDGRNRATACDVIGVEPTTTVYDGDPHDFSLSMNRHRRHMDKVDIAFAVQSMETLRHGGDRKSEKIKSVNTLLKSPTKTRAQIAKDYGIGEYDINDAKAVATKGTAEVIDLVKTKKAVGLRAAANYVRHTPKDRQVADPDTIRNASPQRTTTAGESSATVAVREYVRPLVERGDQINVQEVAKATGYSRIIAEAAIAAERGRQEGIAEAIGRVPINPSVLSKTAQEKLAAFERRLRAQMEAEFEQRVRAEVECRLAARDKRDDEAIEQANALVLHHSFGRSKLPLTPQEYYALLWALHPDNNDPAKATAAFVTVRQKKLLLCDEGPIKRKSDDAPLPKTVADLMAMRKSKSKVA